MASIRNLKKDIDYVFEEVLTDCFMCLQVSNKKNHDKILEIINSATDKRNELVSKINKAPENKKELKHYYKSIKDELFQNADKSFEQLSSIVEKK